MGGLAPCVAWPLLAWPTLIASVSVLGAGCESEFFRTLSECLVSGQLERKVSVFQGPGAGFQVEPAACANVDVLKIFVLQAAAARVAAMKNLGSSSFLGTTAGRACKYSLSAVPFLGMCLETLVCWEVLEFFWVSAGLLVSRVWVVAGLILIQARMFSLLEFVRIFSQLRQGKNKDTQLKGTLLILMTFMLTSRVRMGTTPTVACPWGRRRLQDGWTFPSVSRSRRTCAGHRSLSPSRSLALASRNSFSERGGMEHWGAQGYGHPGCLGNS